MKVGVYDDEGGVSGSACRPRKVRRAIVSAWARQQEMPVQYGFTSWLVIDRVLGERG
jgi:hypothetical protein